MILKIKPIKILLIVALFSIATVTLNTHAADKKPTDYRIKAAFIYNFLKFIEWPANLHECSLTLCIFGDDPFGNNIKILEGKHFGDKEILVKYISSIQDVKEGDILFIASSEKRNIKPLIDTISGLSILTVGDTKKYSENGVIINFYIERSKVRFKINVDTANRAGLKISSKLLNLAKIVRNN